MADNAKMPFEDAVTHIMKALRCSRDVAETKLLEAIAKGKVGTTGVNVNTGIREDLTGKNLVRL
jgi:hypothetical protein